VVTHTHSSTIVGKVSFVKYLLFCRALLQKRPTILRSLLIVATAYLAHDAPKLCTANKRRFDFEGRLFFFCPSLISIFGKQNAQAACKRHVSWQHAVHTRHLFVCVSTYMQRHQSSGACQCVTCICVYESLSAQVCRSMYICHHICIHVYICEYMIYLYIYVDICVYICHRVYVNVYICEYMIYLCIYVNTFFIYLSSHTRKCIYMYMYVHIGYICIYM